MTKLFEKITSAFEWLLWESRAIVLVAVVSSILSAILLTVIGAMDITYSMQGFFSHLGDKDIFYQSYSKLLISVVSAMDLFLISTVLLIFGIGLYEIFIGKINKVEDDTKSSGVLKIYSLDQLKDKLLKVIHVVLVVYFFKYATKFSYQSSQDLLFLAIGIFLIAASMYMTSIASKK